MPGCLPLIAAILMHKFPGSVKLTCPENQCQVMRRLENWKHKDLAATGYIYNLYHYICTWEDQPGEEYDWLHPAMGKTPETGSKVGQQGKALEQSEELLMD